MIISFDMDGVLDNLTTVWCEELNKQYHLTVKPKDIKQWDMGYAYPTLTEKQIYEPLMARHIWYEMQPTDRSQECLKAIQNYGHEVYIVTATHYKNVEWKMKWINKYFPFIDWKHVIITSNKQLIRTRLHIDDYENNLVGGMYTKLLFNQPWNENFNEAKYGIIRVYNFDEIKNKITQMGESKH